MTPEQLIHRWRRNPVRHVEEAQGLTTLEPFQAALIRALERYKRVLCRSAHDLGKTFTAARAVLAFCSVWPNSKVITTAPTFRQVKHLLWAEIRAGFNRSAVPLGGTMLDTEWRVADDWFAIGLTAAHQAGSGKGQGKGSGAQGFHAPRQFIVVDEATGVEKSTWDQIDGMTTSADVRLLAIGNPTTRDSEFCRRFADPTYHKVKWPCFLSPNLQINGLRTLSDLARERDRLMVMPEDERLIRLASYRVTRRHLVTATWVMSGACRWGLDHPLFLSKALAEFPEDEEGAMMTLARVEAAERRELQSPGPKHSIGVDVARSQLRARGNKTVITRMLGRSVPEVKKMQTEDTAEIVDAVTLMILATGSPEGTVIIDATGVGGGVVDFLRRARRDQRIPQNWLIHGVHNGGGPLKRKNDMERFANLRAQMYWLLAEDLDELAIPRDDAYEEQLPQMRYTITGRDKILMEAKEDFCERTGLDSPDEADSLAMANFGRREIGNAVTFKHMPAASSTFAPALGSGDRT